MSIGVLNLSMSAIDTLKIITPLAGISITDQAFNQLYSGALSLELPPNTKLSEVDVARQLGVSRQVVRDAFFRLSILGFLTIRPQKVTIVSRISIQDVLKARYIRMALEMENVRHACVAFAPSSFDRLEQLIEAQRAAIDKSHGETFHRLDNDFHKEICTGAGLEFTWATIIEKKAHTDRVRFLSLTFSAQDSFDSHVEIFASIRKKDPDWAVKAVKKHLSQIEVAIKNIRMENQNWFQDE